MAFYVERISNKPTVYRNTSEKHLSYAPFIMLITQFLLVVRLPTVFTYFVPPNPSILFITAEGIVPLTVTLNVYS